MADPLTPDEISRRVAALIANLQDELRRIDEKHGEARRAAIAASGLPASLVREVLGDSLLPSEPRQSTMTGTEMTSAELKKLPGEQRRRLGIAKAQSNNHPFPRALYRDGKTVTAWAAKHRLNRNVVKAWFANDNAVRPIPRKWAEAIAAAYPDVPATDAVWRGGIKD